MKPTRKPLHVPHAPGAAQSAKLTIAPEDVSGVARRVNIFVQEEWEHLDGQRLLTIEVVTWYEGVMYVVCLSAYAFDVHKECWPFRLSVLRHTGARNHISELILECDNSDGNGSFAGAVRVTECHVDGYVVDGILTATIDRYLQP